MAVTFEDSRDGLTVLVDGEPFGRMRRPEGFFTNDGVVHHLVLVSPDDLRAIADRVEQFCNGPVTLIRKGIL